MNLITILQATQGGSSWPMFAMFGLIFVVMYFFMIRPQRKQQKELENFRNSLKKGDKVITVGGIYGILDQVKENIVVIKVDDNTKIRVSKNSIVKDSSAQ